MGLKKIIFAASLVITVAAVHAQGLYFGGGGSYALPVVRQVLGTTVQSNTYVNTFFMRDEMGTYGNGFGANIYTGYMLNSRFGVEIGASYLLGSKHRFENHQVFSTTASDFEDVEKRVCMLKVTPALRIRLGNTRDNMNPSFFPYLRGGLSLGLWNRFTEQRVRTITTQEGTSVAEDRFLYEGGVAFGFMSGFGVNYKLTSHLFLYAEATGCFMNWAPTRGKRVRSTVDGVDQLNNMPTAEKEFIYVRQLDERENDNPDNPYVALKQFYPLSSVSFTLGMHYSLSATKGNGHRF